MALTSQFQALVLRAVGQGCTPELARAAWPALSRLPSLCSCNSAGARCFSAAAAPQPALKHGQGADNSAQGASSSAHVRSSQAHAHDHAHAHHHHPHHQHSHSHHRHQHQQQPAGPSSSFAASGLQSSSANTNSGASSSSTSSTSPEPGSSISASTTTSQSNPTITTSELLASTSTSGMPFSTGVTTLSTGQGFKKTFYKRKLPSPPAIAFSSPEGRQLFAEALANGHMTGFFKLMEQFSTQDEPAFCGLASLAMVLNALAIDPRRTWKGAWRWFHEQMLDCCRPLEDVKREGITLAQAACLSRCNGARVDLHRHGTFTLEELRKQVLDVCSTGEEHLVVSYSRKPFQQTGDGHFSPVGGYHMGRDLVLILDVARFKYPPHWVSLSQLHDAMRHVDPVTGQPRGFLRMGATPLADSVLLTLDLRAGQTGPDGWGPAAAWARTPAAQLMQEALARAGSAAAPASSPAPAAAPAPTGAASTPASASAQPQGATAAVAAAGGGVTAEAALRALLAGLPVRSALSFLAVREQQHTHAGSGGQHSHEDGVPAERCAPVAAQQLLLTELRATPMYQAVVRALDAGAADPSSTSTTNTNTSSSASSPFLAEKLTLLLLLKRPEEWKLGVAWPNEAVAAQWAALMDLTHMTVVEAELAFLRQQLLHIDEVLEGGSLEAECGSGCSQKLDCAAHGH